MKNPKLQSISDILSLIRQGILSEANGLNMITKLLKTEDNGI